MRVVERTSATWWACGVGSTDVAALVGCSANSNDHCLSVWANKTWSRERPMRKRLLEQAGTEWLTWRKKGVGGSEVSSVLGVGYKSAKAVYEEKTATGDQAEGGYENPAMARGKRLEGPARELYEQLFGWTVPPICVLHDSLDHVRCSLDGLRSDDKLLVEIKCCGPKNHEKLLAIQEIEDDFERQTAFSYALPYYRAQVAYQRLITGVDVVHFLGFNDEYEGNRKLAVITLYPEPDFEQHLLQRVNEFWTYVDNREPPPVEWTTPCYFHPTSIQSTVSP